MAAPTPTARQTPGGIKLENGWSSLITFASDPNIEFWEINVKPPGIDGGEAIDTTTMHNDEWRTFAPRGLKTLTPATTVVAYDPIIYTNILALINVETTITITWPDGTTLAFFGYLRTIEFQDLAEGVMPQASITIVPTNTDGSGVEQDPVLTNVAGT